MATAYLRAYKFLSKTLLGKLAFLFFSIVTISGCASVQETAEAKLIDKQATPQTQALYRNLKNVGQTQILFGHQDTNSYGVHWRGDSERSDVHDVTGSFPAIYGWDLGDLAIKSDKNLDSVSFADMKRWMLDAYKRGGINTISWHIRNPVTGESSWERKPAVKQILPGGDKHHLLKAYLDTFVAFNQQLTVTDEQGNETQIPIIFRPWHEHNGDWFWWGKGLTEEADYIALWRFTVKYLRDEKKVHNLIYAFSPDRSRIDIDNFEEGYLYGYPGDDYVDIIGFDNYWDLGHPSNTVPLAQQTQYFGESLEYLATIAHKKNKVAALTEGGSEAIPNPKFWTEVILEQYLKSENSQRIAYILVWRNANKIKENKDHYYSPYPGHPSENDFIEFYKHPQVLFENELTDMYK